MKARSPEMIWRFPFFGESKNQILEVALLRLWITGKTATRRATSTGWGVLGANCFMGPPFALTTRRQPGVHPKNFTQDNASGKGKTYKLGQKYRNIKCPQHTKISGTDMPDSFTLIHALPDTFRWFQYFWKRYQVIPMGIQTLPIIRLKYWMLLH